ncbi:MAG: hypothetical protein Q7R49_01555 [Candidatus Daviesbacteria bacterium]|nr:hypothetical protein [Candidatus Daviesbacteria bacterium]
MKKVTTAQVIVLTLLSLPLATQVVFAQVPTTNRLQKIETKASQVITKTASREAQLVNRQEKIASREAALKEKLLKFRDKQKATSVTKINANLIQINATRTATMSANLDKMVTILTRLENIVNSVTGKDTTAAKDAILQARAAIDAAKVAVSAQAAQDYNIVVDSETTARQDAKTVRLKLETDLKATQTLIVAARQAIAKAISTTVSTLGGNTNGK